MGYRKEEAYRYALCMDLTPDKFQFSILDPATKVSLHTYSINLTEFTKEVIGLQLQNDLLKADFASHTLTVGTPRNTLLPTELFNFSNPLDAFKLNYPAPVDNLDYNRISELGIVNIYELPLWIKSLFVVAFPRIKIVHRTTVLLKGVFDKPSYSGKIHLFIENRQFYFLISERSKLTYYNRFDYAELADLVYYVLFVLEQKNYDQAQFEIHLYGLPTNWPQLDALQGYFSGKLKIATNPAEAEAYILAKQLLCV